MIVRGDRYAFFAQSANTHYWEQDVYPDWTAFSIIRHFPEQPIGHGVEPHYHDCDESWLFTAGHGQVWLNDQSFAITPNTLVYTPMGTIHHFQMYADGENNAVVTRLERQRRPIHILVERDGPPEPTVPGFVIAGAANSGPIPNPGARCPFTELRMLSLAPDETITEDQLAQNEHWIPLDGALHLTVDGRSVELGKGDIALQRTGAVRQLSTPGGARVLLLRERPR